MSISPSVEKGNLPLPNETGLAVGGYGSGWVTYVVLPGPPGELKPMVKPATYPS